MLYKLKLLRKLKLLYKLKLLHKQIRSLSGCALAAARYRVPMSPAPRYCEYCGGKGGRRAGGKWIRCSVCNPRMTAPILAANQRLNSIGAPSLTPRQLTLFDVKEYE